MACAPPKTRQNRKSFWIQSSPKILAEPVELFFVVENMLVAPVAPVIDERPKSPIERRKRNLKFFSPVSREERETWNSFPQFREEKEKSKKIFSTFERGKRNGFSILKLQEEKEKVITISPFSRREREILNAVSQFWEEKEKSRVHTFREEKEKFSQISCF